MRQQEALFKTFCPTGADNIVAENNQQRARILQLESTNDGLRQMLEQMRLDPPGREDRRRSAQPASKRARRQSASSTEHITSTTAQGGAHENGLNAAPGTQGMHHQQVDSDPRRADFSEQEQVVTRVTLVQLERPRETHLARTVMSGATTRSYQLQKCLSSVQPRLSTVRNQPMRHLV